jgi:hypothetical protein
MRGAGADIRLRRATVNRALASSGQAATGFAIGLLLALAFLHSTARTDRNRSSAPRAPAILEPPLNPGRRGDPPPSGSVRRSRREPLNVDVDAHVRALLAEHTRLLTTQPLLQHLPYRDRRLGIALAGATGWGEPVLLVAYRGSAGDARRDLRALLARVHDRGSEYALRYIALR